ncbi:MULTISPECIES: cytochrome c oxidase subunit II [Undibacterium]|uniref:Cytochrome c oxidase subunit 2 n=1 Tax=Undibacterium aquatile TaxID=1537398 RepID=A0ABR6XI98_9BURK|nr:MULTISPECIES: cytochrome c oxidase subunit II [Undibacterium]MBC3812613.1 cytochrome c oxidase subunit II [Undibacterium aquatile]MBC3877921.1 cytochrome c oxidase subunit II [Undibacterium sp. FT79W]MBY0571056.1 cytochrome c oxidase subunit II [Burkholderiaceae bacterium]
MKHGKRLKSFMLGASLLAAGLPAWAVVDSQGGPAVRQLNLQTPVTQIAEQIYSIHNLMLVICLVIFVAVFGVMFYSILKHRKSLGHKAASFHESTTVEIAWTVVPFLIVIGMALPATKTVVAMKDTSNADITIKATGMQWKWGYDYLKGEGEGISFLSTLSTPRTQVGSPGVAPTEARGDNYLLEVDNQVVVPVNKKVRIITTANDVIHSWTIPAFGVKQDAIPGFVRDTWFKAEKIGVYRGQCVELCGKEHAFMPIVVNVVSDDDYKKWVDTKKKEMAAKADDPNKVWTVDELKQRGEKVYAANCVACHQASGKGVPGAFPALEGSLIVNGAKAGQVGILLNGKNAMPSWKSTLSDTEIAAVITYTRNSWSNKAAENIVQPAEVLAARK